MTTRHDLPRRSIGLFSVWLWWGGIAVIAYLGLHALAAEGVPGNAPEVVRAQMTRLAPAATWQTIGLSGEYVAPAICLGVALVLSLLSVTRRRQTASRSGGASKALGTLDGREFDGLLIDAFKLQGYQLASTGGGIDMVLRKDHETCLVQSKQWRLDKVGVAPLQELFAMMGARNAASGIAVTSGRYGREAVQYAASHAIKLVEGAALLALIERAQTARSRTAMPPIELPPAPPRPAAPPTAVPAPAPGPNSADMIPVADVLPHYDEADEEPPQTWFESTAPLPVVPSIDASPFGALLAPSASRDASPFAALLGDASPVAASPGAASPAAPARVTAARGDVPLPATPPGIAPAKPCPKCGGAMVVRKVRSGPKEGQSVWSCATYPACKGVRRIAPA